MKTPHLIGMIVLATQLVGCGKAPGATIDPTKWKLQLTGVRNQGDVSVYYPLEETEDSSTVIEIAPRPNAPTKVASIALVRMTNRAPVVFVGGALSAPKGDLISIKIDFFNADANPATFRVGDVVLVRPDAKQIRLLGVSKGKSPIFAKLSEKLLSSSKTIPVHVNVGETVRLNYCFIVGPDSFPLSFQFGGAKTDIVLKDLQALSRGDAEDHGFTASLAGALDINEAIPAEKFGASVGNGEPIVRFESTSFGKGDRLPMQGSRCMLTLDGVPENVPLLQMSQDETYIAGRIFILQSFAPIQTNISVGPFELTFSSSLNAEKSDVLGAIMSNHGDSDYVLSVRGVK
jgi:hypothetical protein